MAEKETKSCFDCIHFDVCYKIEHFGRDLEDTSPCEQFIDKNVAPVKHGHFRRLTFSNDTIICSECKMAYNIFETNGAENFNFCPHCGTKIMDGGEEND